MNNCVSVFSPAWCIWTRARVCPVPTKWQKAATWLAQGKHTLTANCLMGRLEFKFFLEPWICTSSATLSSGIPWNSKRVTCILSLIIHKSLWASLYTKKIQVTSAIFHIIIQMSYTVHVRISIFWLVDLYHVTLGCDEPTSLTSFWWCNSQGVMALAYSKFDNFCLQCIQFE